MAKLNCWEFHKCSREPDGNKVDELGPCPAPNSKEFNGINGGTNGGRVCWYISGFDSDGSCIRCKSLAHCVKCEFFHKVSEEEGRFFKLIPDR